MGLFSSDPAGAYGEAIASTLQRKPGTRAARSSNACCSGDETHALAQIRGRRASLAAAFRIGREQRSCGCPHEHGSARGLPQPELNYSFAKFHLLSKAD